MNTKTIYLDETHRHYCPNYSAREYLTREKRYLAKLNDVLVRRVSMGEIPQMEAEAIYSRIQSQKEYVKSLNEAYDRKFKQKHHAA